MRSEPMARIRLAFESGESIHTETSRKYALADLDGFVGRAGWCLDRTWTDEDGLFAVLGLSVAGAAVPVGMPVAAA